MKTIIKNGHVVDPANKINGRMDILVLDGIIAAVGEDLPPEGAEIIDGEGRYVLPGLVDVHTHLREPGFEYKEDISTGTRSAAAGGITSVACMANTNPVGDNRSVMRYIIDKAKDVGVVNVYPIGAITKGLKGEELTEISELKAAGAIAVSDDGKPVANAATMKEALIRAAELDIPVICHCEDPHLAEGGAMNEGMQSAMMGLKGIPSSAEDVMVARDVLLAEYTGTPVHIAHVSTEVSVEIIRHAKARGVRVTTETCPHYFTLTDEACSGFNTLAKVNPPLRTPKDRQAIIQGLKDGTIDMIATDHAPHHPDEKNMDYAKAANGLVGFETSLPLTYTYLVKPGHITLEDMVRKMSLRPAEFLGIGRGKLSVGSPADIIMVDFDQEYVVDIESFRSKSKNSPFNGFKVSGKVTHTMVGGKLVLKDGALCL